MDRFFPFCSRFPERFVERKEGNQAVFRIANLHILINAVFFAFIEKTVVDKMPNIIVTLKSIILR